MSFKSLSQKIIVVVGLGISGISVSRKLIKSKVKLFGWDDNYKTREKAKSLGIEIKKIKDIDFKKVDFLVLSPGIPHLPPNQHIPCMIRPEILWDIE